MFSTKACSEKVDSASHTSPASSARRTRHEAVSTGSPPVGSGLRRNRNEAAT